MHSPVSQTYRSSGGTNEDDNHHEDDDSDNGDGGCGRIRMMIMTLAYIAINNVPLQPLSELVCCWCFSPLQPDRLVGLVVKASSSGAEDPGFESRW